MDSEVDVNILVNQNILLEAKIESLTKDYSILQEKLSNYENQDTENE